MPETAEVRQRDAAIPLRGYRLDHLRKDHAVEIGADFYSDIAMTSMTLWTNIATRLRVKIGAGAYAVVGTSRAAAVDLGAFTAGETKQGTIEVKVGPAEDVRHEDIELNLGTGVG